MSIKMEIVDVIYVKVNVHQDAYQNEYVDVYVNVAFIQAVVNLV